MKLVLWFLQKMHLKKHFNMVKWQMVDAFQILTATVINRAAHAVDIVDSVMSIAIIGTASSQDFCSL